MASLNHMGMFRINKPTTFESNRLSGYAQNQSKFENGMMNISEFYSCQELFALQPRRCYFQSTDKM